jgi:CPA2 family monovalent cation:H+ antiporter-2
VTALDFSKFVTLDQRDFRQFLRRFPEIREKVTALAAERGAKNRQWLDEEADAHPPGAGER